MKKNFLKSTIVVVAVATKWKREFPRSSGVD